MGEVVDYIGAVHSRNPTYYWHISCYHYETRTVTVGSGKNRRTETRSVKVTTYTNSTGGTIPAMDLSDTFVPNTSAKLVQLDCTHQLDLSSSNYPSRQASWMNANSRDQYQVPLANMLMSCTHGGNVLTGQDRYRISRLPYWYACGMGSKHTTLLDEFRCMSRLYVRM